MARCRLRVPRLRQHLRAAGRHERTTRLASCMSPSDVQAPQGAGRSHNIWADSPAL